MNEATHKSGNLLWQNVYILSSKWKQLFTAIWVHCCNNYPATKITVSKQKQTVVVDIASCRLHWHGNFTNEVDTKSFIL